MTDMISYDSFFEKTTANFIAIDDVPSRNPDYVSYKFGSVRFDENGNMIRSISSRYWYGEDENGKFVIRESDHWSYVGKNLPICPINYNERRRMQNNPWVRLTPIATCFWLLKTGNMSSKVRVGKAYLSDFNKLN